MLNYDQRKQVFQSLVNEHKKCSRAVERMQKLYDAFPANSVERETAAVMLSLYQSQCTVAAQAVADYFENYLKV